MCSLTPEAYSKMLAEAPNYHIAGVPCGMLLVKLLLRKAIVDTRATSTMFRENLSGLDSYVASVNSDVSKINQYVKLNYEGLKARGERCDDIMANLFKGYLAVSDKQFHAYMQIKKNEYDDDVNITPERLMQLALNKYEVLTTKDIWGAPSEEE